MITDIIQYSHDIDHTLFKTRNVFFQAMYKLLTIFIALFFTTASALLAQENPQITGIPTHFGTITVHIVSLKNLEGKLGVSLYNSKKGFPGKHEQAYASTMKKITSTADNVVFDNLPYGTYAVSIMHDENNNGKLDTTFIGIPKEGVGVSNNPKIGMGGPKFNDSVITLDAKELEVTVSMRYL
jgi:uncharacterized protein (DUF2141 family)